MRDPLVLARVQRKYQLLAPERDERRRRQWAAVEARDLGWGGISLVARATGLSRPTIRAGLRELDSPPAQRALEPLQVRRPGGGPRSATAADPGLLAALELWLDPVARGDPESPSHWTCESTRRLAEELTRQNHRVGPRTVAALLHQSGYRLQANRKTREGIDHPDRNAQFEYIDASVARALVRGQPAISVDTKKKESVGDFKNGGREWHPQGKLEQVRVHDSPDKTLGKAIPYGVYDLLNDQGWVSVGIEHDTALFATNSIRRRWREMGGARFPKATEWLITAEGGGGNGHRTRLWKVSLQGLADDLGLSLRVSHFPPGASKWHKIEHRLFSFITQNWRGQPLVSHQTIVDLIAGTTTKTGLILKAALDINRYATEIEISDEELAGLCLERHEFHGDWNHTISPSPKRTRSKKL